MLLHEPALFVLRLLVLVFTLGFAIGLLEALIPLFLLWLSQGQDFGHGQGLMLLQSGLHEARALVDCACQLCEGVVGGLDGSGVGEWEAGGRDHGAERGFHRVFCLKVIKLTLRRTYIHPQIRNAAKGHLEHLRPPNRSYLEVEHIKD